MNSDIGYISQILDVPIGKLYMLSNNDLPRKRRKTSKYENYHTVVIHRGRGHKNRILSVPNGLLKKVQRRLLDNFLYDLKPSKYSTAYRRGVSLLDNASPHAGRECIIKLDISHFFDSIDDDMVFFVMKKLWLSLPAVVLLTHLCTYKNRLPQGAPTSPHIANLVMKDFDEKIGRWCSENNLAYTRYCDDMTFSGTRADVKKSNIVSKARKMLKKMGFELNEKKTVFISTSQQQRVTGIVVNEKPALSRNQRRAIRQEVYYCKRYGVEGSLTRRGEGAEPEKYLYSLLGRISFALQIDSENDEMMGYFGDVKEMLNNMRK